MFTSIPAAGRSAGRGRPGEPVTLPASQLNLAVCGGTGEGKSYLAGLICEQLVRLGYSLVVFDPEGDHLGLGELQGVFVTGGHERRLADPAEVVRLLRHGHTSVVVDLSHLDAAARAAYAAGLASEVEAHRAATGLPQWLVIDEAHVPIGRDGTALGVIDPATKGYLLVTWRPEDLSADALAAIDAVIALGSAASQDPLVEITAAVAGMPRAEIARLLAGPAGRAVLAWRAPRPGGGVHPRVPDTPHLRHEHKYHHVGVEPARRFYFRTESDAPTGAVAANLDELEAELGRCDRACCATTAPAMSSPAGSPASFGTSRSPPTSPPPKPPCRPTATPKSSNRYAWRSSPHSKPAPPAEIPRLALCRWLRGRTKRPPVQIRPPRPAQRPYTGQV